MFADSLIVPECIFRPGSFTGLMTLYESNYIKLCRLITDFKVFSGDSPQAIISCCDADCDLHLEVTLREPYTTTLRLTYLFCSDSSDSSPEQLIPDPDLTIRVYHDAQLVEVVRNREEYRHHKLQELTRVHSRELGWRWRNNMTLNKWLDYLLDMGHGFAGQSATISK